MSGGTLELGVNVGNHNYSTFSMANNVAVNGGAVYVNDAFQHLTGTVNISASGATMGSTYIDYSTNVDGNGDVKGLFIDGPLTGSGNLALKQSGYDTGHNYDGSVVYFTNSGTGTYNGTITVYNQDAASGSGGYLFLVGNNALAQATISLSGTIGAAGDNLPGARFGTSTLLFGAGNNTEPASSAYTIGGLAGSAPLLLADTLVSPTGFSTGNPVALTVGGNNQSTAYSGALSGAGSLIKAGTGQLLLSGSSTFTGGITVTSGTVQAGNAFAFGAGPLTVNAGVVDLNGINVTVGAISGSAGGLITTTTGGLTTLTSNTAGAGSYAGVISDGAGQVAFVKAGAGTEALTGVNTYSGGTTINAGILQISSTNSLGAISGTATINSGGTLEALNAIQTSRTFALNGAAGFNADSGIFEIDSALTDGTSAVTLVKGGPGILDLTASNSYSGGTVINAGTVQISTSSNLGAPSGAATINNGGVLEALNAIDTSRNFLLSGSATFQPDSGVFEIDGAVNDGNPVGTLVMNGAGVLDLTASNGYSGGTVINTGTLQVNADNNLGASSGGVTIGNPGTLEVLPGDSIATARNFALTGTGTVQVDPGASYSISGNIADGAGPGSLNKSGSGTLTIAGIASNTGNVNVNQGTLIVSGSLSGGGPVTVNSGGTLGGATGVFNTGGTINGPVTVAQGGTIAPGAQQTFAGTVLTINNNLTLSGAANVALNLDGSNNNNADYLAVGGTLTLDPSSTDTLTLTILGAVPASPQSLTYIIAIYGGESGTFGSVVLKGDPAVFQSINYDYQELNEIAVTLSIPEPGTYGTLLSGAALLLAIQRARRRKAWNNHDSP